MSRFRRRRSRQTPPISLILLLVGFILVAFVFIGFRQLRGAQERRLRLLAGFGERVESTVEDLAERYVRIVGVEEDEEPDDDQSAEKPESTANGAGGQDTERNQTALRGPQHRDVQYVRQRKESEVIRYLDHVPYTSHLHLSPDCPQLQPEDDRDENGIEGTEEPATEADDSVQRAERAADRAEAEADRAEEAAERAVREAGRAEGSVELWATGPYARLKYCPPTSAVLVEPSSSEEEQDTVPSNEPESPGSNANARDEEALKRPRGYLAQINLEGLIEPMIIPGVFESILLANHQGEVLFQQGESVLRMLDLGPLIESTAEREDGENALTSFQALLERQGSVDPEIIRRTFEAHENRSLELGARTAMVEVKIAGSDYFVFLQPVSPRLEPPPRHGAGEPVRWIAAGVISSEHLLSSGLTTSPFLLFILVSILPLGIITWPFLKLALITRRQRFNRLDLASLLFATVVGIALAALLVFDLLFLARIHQNVDQQLADVGDEIAARFNTEVLDARDQLVQLDKWVTLGSGDSSVLQPSTEGCGARRVGHGAAFKGGAGATSETVAPRDDEGSSELVCPEVSHLRDLHPIPVLIEHEDGLATTAAGLNRSRAFIAKCVREFLGVPALRLAHYPYFDSVFWANKEGDHACANLPLRQHATLPQNVKDREYFLCARKCNPEPVFLPGTSKRKGALSPSDWQACGDHVFSLRAHDTVPVCLRSFLDRTTGESVAAVALPSRAEGFPVTALVARLTSVGHPVLPRQFGFAIVEPSGQVLFHSDSRRDLTENFLEASDENPVLHSMIENGRRGLLGLNYWGQPTRVHVRPLEGLNWSLITYRNTYDLRVRNFELIYDFLNPFLLYLAAVLLVALVAWFAAPRWLRAYLWPSATLRRWYRAICIACLLVTGVFALVLQSGHPESIFFASCLAVPASAALALLVLWLSAGRTDPKSSEHIDRPEGTRLDRKNVANPEEGATIGERLREGAHELAAKAMDGRAYLKTAWHRKRGWLPGSFLLLLGILVCTALASGGPAMPVLLGGTALGLFAALAWRWHDFEGERRQVAFVFAAGCSLLVVALLPALGYFSLARSRQTQLYTQETQVELARRLEERRGEIEARQGPIAEIYGEDRPYSNELKVTRDAYLKSFFGTTLGEPIGNQEPFWLYGLPGERDEETTSDTEPPGVVERLLSARPFPLNDLSARPVESDLSRFESTGLDWTRKGQRNLVLAATTHRGAGQENHLGSTVPDTTTLDRVPFLKGVTVVLGLLLLAASPFLLAFFIADRVLLISLVGQPSSKGPSRESLLESAARMAGKPLAMILDEVRRTREVVRQVVLVSALPGRSAWKYQVRDPSAPAVFPRATPLFHKVSFVEAWRKSELPPQPSPVSPGDTPEAGAGSNPGKSSPGEEGPDASPGAEPVKVSTLDRTGRFRAGLLPQDDPEDPEQEQPILITDFDPDFADPDIAEAQTAALRTLSAERSVVIVAETVPDPEVLGEDEDDDPQAAEARRQWSGLLARFSVTYGYDARTHDLAKTVSRIEREQLEPLREKADSPAMREDLWNISSIAWWVVRECSPTPVLRNIGWALLHEIRDVLVKLLESLEEKEERFQEERVRSAVKRIATAESEEGRRKAIQHLAEMVGETEIRPAEGEEGLSDEIRRAASRLTQQPDEGAQGTAIEEAVRQVATGEGKESQEVAVDRLAELLEETEAPTEEKQASRKELAERIRLAARRLTPQEESGEEDEDLDTALRQVAVPNESQEGAQKLQSIVEKTLGEESRAEQTPERTELVRRLQRAARRITDRREWEKPSEALDEVKHALGSNAAYSRETSLLAEAAAELRNEELLKQRIDRAQGLLQLFTRDHVVTKVGTEARLHYRYLWSLCTTDEKLVLVQLAEDGLVNPKYFGWLMDLMNRGLVVRDPEVRLMNASFGRFVRQEVRRSQILDWEEEEGPSAWNVLKWILPAPLILVAVFLFATQRDALSNVTGVIVAAVSLAPILINLYGQFRQVNVRREAREEEKKDNKEEGSDKGSK